MKIFVAGGSGMVGSAILRALDQPDITLLFPSRKDVDLLNKMDLDYFFRWNQIDQVILAAAMVGGIAANSSMPGAFIRDNLAIESNVINSAFEAGIKNLLFMGSSCVYPRECPQPIKEEYLLTGPLEKTNEAYAIAKIAGIKMCQHFAEEYKVNYKSVMPCNLYGPNDNYETHNSHVIPGMIKKFHYAKEAGSEYIVLWGDGSPLREFLHVDDLARFVRAFLANQEKFPNMTNMGSGAEISIRNLAGTIKVITGFQGDIRWDETQPNGTPRKLLDNFHMQKMGYYPRISLMEGLKDVYNKFLAGNGRNI